MAVNPKSHIICVTGGKGGVGKSVFAANLSLAFLTEIKSPTLLVDLDSQSCGDQNMLLGIQDPKTLLDLTNFTGGINQQTISSVVNRHPSGLGYVAAVKNRDETLNSAPDMCIRQIEALSNFFQFIVVDLGSQLGPLQQAIIDKATVLLIVTTPETLAVMQTARMLDLLMGAALPGDMLHLVVNRSSPSALPAQLIGQNLKKNVIGDIPQDDVTVVPSVLRSAPFMLTAAKTPLASAYRDIVRKLTGGVLQNLKNMARPQATKFQKAEPAASDAGGSRFRSGGGGKPLDPRTALKLMIHGELVKDPELKKAITDTKNDPSKEKELYRKTQSVISQIVDREAGGMAREERAQIITEVLDEALGLGPLQTLLEDPAVSEIMVNGHNKIYIEKSGLIQLSPVTFTSNAQLRIVIERIVSPLGRQINESSPYVDARLKDGSRVNAVIEPLAIDGPAVTIRKFSKKPVSVDTYVQEFKAASQNMMDFLRVCVQNRLNVVISGGTGSGKTTLLNTLSSFIPTNERVVTIEDAAELQLKQDHVVRLESRPANMEGKGAVTIRDLVKNSLRMRPDRIVVGECRDGAALDMLSAMNTSHDGSMTTVHANNPREAISRLETLCMMAGMDLPAKAIREQIASAVHLIIQISRLSDGSRKLISITEVQGMQGDVVTLQEVFCFKEKDFDKNRKIIGNFHATGLIPKFIEKFERRGIIIPKQLFSNDTPPPAAAKPVPSAAPQPAAAAGTMTNTAANPLKKASGSGGTGR